MKFVIIVAPPNDAHALSVANCIEAERKDLQPLILPGEEFPINYSLSISNDEWTIENSQFRISSSSVRSIWWRRPGSHQLDHSILDINNRDFARREANHAFDLIGLSRRYPVINRPDAEMRAGRKPIQLWEASEAGLSVPEYCITNSPFQARQFISDHPDNVIFKTLTSPRNTFGETRKLTGAHLDIIDQVSLAPVIFQKLIRRRNEYRVTVIGDAIFTHRVVINNKMMTDIPDWRLDVSAEMEKSVLPQTIISSIQRLMKQLSLSYGAIDLIEDEENNIHFLEINPTGQFLFAEIDTTDAMSNAFAKLLCDVSIENEFQSGQ